jgi:hypothetical protein
VDSAGWPAATPFFLCLVIFFPFHCLFCLGFRVSSSRSEYVICNWFCTVKYCGQCRCVRVNSFFIINMLQAFDPPFDMGDGGGGLDTQDLVCSEWTTENGRDVPNVGSERYLV